MTYVLSRAKTFTVFYSHKQAEKHHTKGILFHSWILKGGIKKNFWGRVPLVRKDIQFRLEALYENIIEWAEFQEAKNCIYLKSRLARPWSTISSKYFISASFPSCITIQILICCQQISRIYIHVFTSSGSLITRYSQSGPWLEDS